MICSHFDARKWAVFGPYIVIHLICDIAVMSYVVYALEMVIWSFIRLIKWFNSNKCQWFWKFLMFVSVQQTKQIDFDILVVLSSAAVGMSNLFLYCYFGEMATQGFGDMGDSLYDTNWQNLPITSQKNLILIIAITQRSISFQGSRFAVLNMDTFCSVNKT